MSNLTNEKDLEEEDQDLNKCGVCYDEFDDNDWTNKPYTLFPCGHTFCISCINSLNEAKCPSCKSSIENKAPNWILIQILTKNAIKPAKLLKLAKCIEEGNKELEDAKLKLLEKNIADLKEIENMSLNRTNKLIEKLNSLKTILPEKISQLVKVEEEKLSKLKIESEKNRETSLVQSMTNLKIDDKDQLLSIKKDLDKKLNALKLCKRIEATKKESGPEFKLIMLEDSIIDSLSGLFIQNLPTSILINNNNGESNVSQSSKTFLLFSEKEKGYLDQNYYGYIRNDYHGRASIDLEEEKTNPYLRWIFSEKNGYFHVENPKTRKLLSWYSENHCTTQREMENYGTSEYAKWTVIHFKIEDTRYVMLKSYNTKQFLTAQNYKKYSPGESNNQGFHMTDEMDEDKAYFDVYLRWKLIELTSEQLKDREIDSLSDLPGFEPIDQNSEPDDED